MSRREKHERSPEAHPHESPSTCTARGSIERLEQRSPNLVLVHLPLHASWLNQIEIYFSIVQCRVLERNDFENVGEVARTLSAFERRRSYMAAPFNWRFTRDDLTVLMNRLSMSEPELRLAA